MSNAVATWIAVTAAAVLAAFQSYGKVRALLGRWRKDRRRAAAEEGDATIADLRQQLSYLKDEVKAMRAEHDADYVQLRAHQAWDRQVFIALGEAGIDVDPPPPLWRTT